MATASGLAALAAGVALLAASSPVEAGPGNLEPDLVTLAINQDDLLIQLEDDRVMFRFTNEIGNRGNGPLEIQPSAESLDCDGDADPANDRDATQRVFADSNGTGLFERGTDGVAAERRFGCMRYHPAHDHWHVLDIATYELRREPPGKTRPRGEAERGPAAPRRIRSRKVGFCLTDARLAFPTPTSQLTSTYPVNPQGVTNCQSVTTQGISSGWADAYAFALPGQALDVTDLPHGRYCLTTRADPTGVISELDEFNNVRRVHLSLQPSRLAVRKLSSPCRT